MYLTVFRSILTILTSLLLVTGSIQVRALKAMLVPLIWMLQVSHGAIVLVLARDPHSQDPEICIYGRFHKFCILSQPLLSM